MIPYLIFGGFLLIAVGGILLGLAYRDQDMVRRAWFTAIGSYVAAVGALLFGLGLSLFAYSALRLLESILLKLS